MTLYYITYSCSGVVMKKSPYYGGNKALEECKKIADYFNSLPLISLERLGMTAFINEIEV